MGFIMDGLEPRPTTAPTPTARCCGAILGYFRPVRGLMVAGRGSWSCSAR